MIAAATAAAPYATLLINENFAKFNASKHTLTPPAACTLRLIHNLHNYLVFIPEHINQSQIQRSINDIHFLPKQHHLIKIYLTLMYSIKSEIGF